MRPSKTGPERQASLVRVEFDCALHGTVNLSDDKKETP
jgi:hypothetical protein